MSIDRRDVLGFAALAGGFALATPMSVAGGVPNSEQGRLAELDCAKVVMRFFDRLDALNRLRGTARIGEPSAPAGDKEDPWGLMTADGSWRRSASMIDSRAAWEKAIGALPAGLVTAHLVCNLIVDARGETRAAASFRLLIFSATSEHGAVPVKLGPPGAILMATAELSRTSGDWRIQTMSSDAVFHF